MYSNPISKKTLTIYISKCLKGDVKSEIVEEHASVWSPNAWLNQTSLNQLDCVQCR